MATRKTRKTRKPVRKATRRAHKVSRPWTQEEIAFMRKYYRRFETAWCARQLRRTVYSVRYKAVDLNIKKANPSVWKGNRGPANAFSKGFGTPVRKTTRRATTKRSTSRTRRSWRASTTRKTSRKPKARRTTRRSR